MTDSAKDPGPGHNRIRQLVDRLAAGALSEDDHLELDQIIADDSSQRKYYLEQTFLVGQLQWRLRENQSEPAETASLSANVSAAAPSALGFLADVWQAVSGSPRTLMTIVGSVLAGYFLVVFALIPLARWTAAGRGPAQSSNNAAPRTVPTVEVGSIAAAAGVRWSQAPSDTTVRLGRRYALAEGRVEFVLARGTRIVIEGPADWQFDTEQQLQLNSGRIAAQVPRAAVGFTVCTPTASIVDLGTEFSVFVDGGGGTNLAVLHGTVELSKREVVAPQPGQSDPPVRVAAGQGLKVSRLRSGAVTAQVAEVDADWARQALAQKLAVHSPLADLAAGRRVAAFQVDANAAGNQGYFHGGLGLNFSVEQPIRMYSLGVFDHLSDGIDAESELTVQLWTFESGQFKNPNYESSGHVLVERSFSADSTGELLAGYRYKNLDKPLELPTGKYSVVAYGFSERNRNFNDHCDVAVDPNLRLATSNLALSAVESAFTFSGPGTFPEIFQKAALCYAAGSFEYAPLEPKAQSKSPQ